MKDEARKTVTDAARARGDEAAITREELKARLADPSLAIVDVLSREAFEAARIPGSLSLPLPEIASRAAEVLPDRNQEIAVYCGSET